LVDGAANRVGVGTDKLSYSLNIKAGNWNGLFAKYGLGKSLMQLHWAKWIAQLGLGQVIILAPLAVAKQTEQEACKFGIDAKYCQTPSQIDTCTTPIVVTNYERLKGIDTSDFVGVVLDESSCLKAYSGKTKQLIFDKFKNTKYKLCCSATPSPNNYLELLNHSEFLGIESTHQTIARFFRNDTMNAGGYVLKPYAKESFWAWVSSWAVCLTQPSDLGFRNEGWDIPEPKNFYHTIPVDHQSAWKEADKHGQLSLIRMPSNSATSVNKEGRLNAGRIAAKVAELVKVEPDEAWVIWCFTNYEADALAAAVPGAVDLRGSDTIDAKEAKLTGFSDGSIQVLITKPKIAGMGLNWQHARRQAFCMGTSYSFEQFHQAMHRLIRFGQHKTVHTHLVFPETVGNVRAIFNEKERRHDEMQRELIAVVSAHGLGSQHLRNFDAYAPQQEMHLPMWLKSQNIVTYENFELLESA
ncbi:MAG: DEAD/DEAH box helicase, partial [Cyanobacteria bacterium P01_A01_bin.17]